MSQRTRGSEVTVQVVIDGDLKTGSWSRVQEWSITPKQEIQETGFQGELEDDFDFSHHGYAFDITLQELDPQLRDVLLDLVAREEARTAYPDVQIVLTIKHRTTDPETLVLENAVFKFDSFGSSSKKDYITTKLSGMFRKLSRP